jgi:outer membrane protein
MSLPTKKRLSMALTLSIAASFSSFGQAETLAEVYGLALENDHQLKADHAAYLASKENYKVGLAGLLPQISASVDYTDATEDKTNNLAADNFNATSSEQEQTGWTVTLSQPLFNMASWFGYQQGKVLSQQAEAQYSADQQSLIVRVADAYFNTLRSVDNLETAQAEEKALSHQLEQTRQRFDVGLTAITDVHEAQAAYDTAVASKLGAQGNLGISFEALEVLTGQSHTEIAPMLENFPIVSPEPAGRHEWVEFALQNNYALKTSKLSAESARQNARAKKAGHYPTLTATARLKETDEDGSFGTQFDTSSESDFIGLSLSVPIYSGGRTSAQRRQAYQQQMQAQELYNKTQRDIIQSARSLHLTVATDVAQVTARKQTTVSSRSALEATQAGYEVGTRNLVDVLIAQRSLYTAQRNYDNARYDYVISMLKLKEVAGNLSPEDMHQLTQWLDGSKQVERSTYE